MRKRRQGGEVRRRGETWKSDVKKTEEGIHVHRARLREKKKECDNIELECSDPEELG